MQSVTPLKALGPHLGLIWGARPPFRAHLVAKSKNNESFKEVLEFPYVCLIPLAISESSCRALSTSVVCKNIPSSVQNCSISNTRSVLKPYILSQTTRANQTLVGKYVTLLRCSFTASTPCNTWSAAVHTTEATTCEAGGYHSRLLAEHILEESVQEGPGGNGGPIVSKVNTYFFPSDTGSWEI